MNVSTIEKEESALKLSERFDTFPVRVFRVFSSLRLALFLIFSLILVFAAGTIVESLHGTDAAALLVYQTPWFAVLLFLLGINLTASAIDRLPWKKKHIGFVMTHAGIIIVMIGSFITQKFMIDAQLVIEEGKIEHRLTLPDPVLYIFSEAENHEWIFPLKKRPLVWKGRENFESLESRPPFETVITHYYPKGRLREEITSSDQGAPALNVTIQNSFVNETFWLIQNDEKWGVKQLGPAKFQFTDKLLEEKKQEISEAGFLEFIFKDKTIPIALTPQMTLPAEFLLEGTAYKVTLTGLYREAIIEGNKLVEKAGAEKEWKNPAVVLTFEGNGIQEKHTVFAKFPDFPTQHGMKPSAAELRIVYRMPASPAGGPGGGSQGESHELRFVKTAEGLVYQVQKGLEVKTGKVNIGEEISTGWMDLKFKVEIFYESATPKKTFTPEPNRSESLLAFPAIQIEARDGENIQKVWLAQGDPERVFFNGKEYHFLYGQKKLPLGFKVKLRDFRVQNYPGTNRAASFESDVTLQDDFRGVQKDVLISMNEPLDHNGFRIFQASYMQPENAPEISVFSVVRDPGIWVKYSGTIIMISGIMLMFFSGRFNFKKSN